VSAAMAKNTLIKTIYGDILLYIFIPCMLAYTYNRLRKKEFYRLFSVELGLVFTFFRSKTALPDL